MLREVREVREVRGRGGEGERLVGDALLATRGPVLRTLACTLMGLRPADSTPAAFTCQAATKAFGCLASLCATLLQRWSESKDWLQPARFRVGFWGCVPRVRAPLLRSCRWQPRGAPQCNGLAEHPWHRAPLSGRPSRGARHLCRCDAYGRPGAGHCQAGSGAVKRLQCLVDPIASPDAHVHGLLRGGVYGCVTDGVPELLDAPAPAAVE